MCAACCLLFVVSCLPIVDCCVLVIAFDACLLRVVVRCVLGVVFCLMLVVTRCLMRVVCCALFVACGSSFVAVRCVLFLRVFWFVVCCLL